MQKLVYKNYNKFIIATETIKDMKESVGNMEGKMKLLAKSIDEITETSTIINNNLATKREKIENLSGINRMLKKLQFLLVLPSRLTDCLALKSYAIAVRDYLRAEKILKQYRHLPSFHSIEIECSEIMTKLKTTLHESVKVYNIPRQTLKTHHQLLFQLGESPELLLKQFLAFREKDLTNRLGEFKHQKNKDLRTNLQDLNKNFVKTYQAHYELYKHVFEVPDVSPEVKLKPILGEFTSKMFTNYFQVLRDLFLNKFTPEIIPTNLNFKEGVSNEKEKKKVEKSLENLRDIMVSLSTEISLVDEKVPSAKISTLLSSFLFDYLYSFLNLNLIQFKQDVSNSLDFYTHLSRKEELNINLTATSFSKNIENDLIDIISELNHFYDLKISSLNQKNLSILVDKTVEILDYLKEYLVSNSSKKSEIRLSSVDERITTTPNGALLLCKFATEMENVTSKSIIDRISVFDTSARAKFTSKFGEASSKMLVYYIEKQSDVLSELIVDGLNAIDWKNLSTSPIGVSKVVVNYAEEILHVNKDISVIFQDDSDDEKTDSYSEGSSAFQYKKSGFGFDDNSGITKVNLL
jgi:vacuolar protein sorting-associated protein 51